MHNILAVFGVHFSWKKYLDFGVKVDFPRAGSGEASVQLPGALATAESPYTLGSKGPSQPGLARLPSCRRGSPEARRPVSISG